MFKVKYYLFTAMLLCLSACGGTDYLADVTKDTHSGCFSQHTNYMGFTVNTTFVHLGDNGAAINASPDCSGITAGGGQVLPSGTGSGGSGTIPLQPAPVGKTTGNN